MTVRTLMEKQRTCPTASNPEQRPRRSRAALSSLATVSHGFEGDTLRPCLSLPKLGQSLCFVGLAVSSLFKGPCEM